MSKPGRFWGVSWLCLWALLHFSALMELWKLAVNHIQYWIWILLYQILDYFFKTSNLLTPPFSLLILSIFTSVPSTLNYFCPPLLLALSLSSLCPPLLLTVLSPSGPSVFTHLPHLLGSVCLCLLAILHSLHSFTKARNTKLPTAQISLSTTPNPCRTAPTVMISCSNLHSDIFASWDVYACLRADMQNN